MWLWYWRNWWTLKESRTDWYFRFVTFLDNWYRSSDNKLFYHTNISFLLFLFLQLGPSNKISNLVILIKKQECIPVGCVPPAHWSAVSRRGGVCIPCTSPFHQTHTPFCHACPLHHTHPFTTHAPLCHTCPPLPCTPPTMHAPLSPCMHPLGMHAPCQPCMPPTMHTPLPTMHAPWACLPPVNHAPPTMHTPPGNHAYPPANHACLPCQPHMPPQATTHTPHCEQNDKQV